MRASIPSLPFWLAVTLGLLAASGAQALDPEHGFRQIGVDIWSSVDGLPQNTVQAVLQTRDGYVWIGTQAGLVRFDGVRFVPHNTRTTPAILHDDIQALAETADGSLWIATYGGGLVRRHKGAFTLMDEPGMLGPRSNIRSLHCGSSGRLWIGTYDEGLFVWDGHALRNAGLPQSWSTGGVNAIAEAVDGTVWAATARGLLRLKAGEWESVPMPCGEEHEVSALHLDPDGSLWIGTYHNLVAVRGADIKVLTAPPERSWDYVQVLLRDRHGVLWIGTYGAGLLRLEGDTMRGIEKNEFLRDDSIHTLFEDRDGSLWVGTTNGGVCRLRDTPFVALDTTAGLPTDHVRVIERAPDGTLWIGMDTGGLARVRDGVVARVYSVDDGLPGNVVHALCAARDGSIWLGTDRGIGRLAGDRVTTLTVADGLAQEKVRAIYEDKHGNIWIGTRGGGVSLLRDGRFTNFDTESGLPDNVVRWIEEDRAGDLWIVTEGGPVIWRDGAFAPVPSDLAMTGLYSMQMHEDETGVKWLATYGNGVIRYENGKAVTLGQKDGLFTDIVYAVAEDRLGRLWMPCDKGIYGVGRDDINRYLAGELEKIPYVMYSSQNGFPGTECNGGSQPSVLTDLDGQIWFATNGGAIQFDPAHVRPDSVAPSVVIESVVVGRAEVSGSDLMRITPGRRDLEIGYTGLSFRNPQGVRFRYLLDGFDDNWVEAGARRTAYYTNLPPGDYVFHVSACNADGVWSRGGASVRFRMLPYFYETTWFRLFCVLALLAITVGGVMWRYRQMQTRQEELESMVTGKTRELAAAKEAALAASRAKSEFLANMSHEIRTPMNAIIAMTDLVRETPLAPDQKESLDIVSLSAQGLLELLNDILDFSKIEADKLELSPHAFDVRDLLDDTLRTLALRAEQKGLDLTGRVAKEVPDRLVGDSHRLKQVLINLLGNAIKFTEKGEVAVEITEAGRDADGVVLNLAVKDTGQGVTPEQAQRIFAPFSQADASVTRKHGGTGLGLTICSSLVELFGGEIGVTNNEAGGATFHFTARVGFDPATAGENTRDLGLILCSILVVDGSDRHRTIVREILEQRGATVAEAVDGEAAIAMIRRAAAQNRGYDFVVCEYAPPRTDVLDLVRVVREASPVRTDVLMLATLSGMAEARRLADPLVKAHLVKPVKQKELLRALRAELQGRAQQAAQERDAAAVGADAAAGRLRVLVAEDNQVNQVVVRRILEKHDHDVTMVENGREALDALAKSSFDVVLMDMQMPELDGLQATRMLRRREREDHLPRTPVVALTAHAMVGDRERCLESGADEYVTKPINAGQLMSTILDLMEARSPALS